MSSRPLLNVASAQSALQRAQMSHPNPLANALAKPFAPQGGRGRSVPPRPVITRVPGDVGRDEFLRFWSGLLLRRCGSAREVAYIFRRTEQTGRNWIDGVACPTGLDVARALSLWPGDFAAFSGQAARRAA